MIVLLVMAAAGTLIFRAKWGPFGYFLVLGAVACFWTAALFGLLHALFRNRNQAGALSAPIILAFSLFGGSMMSPEAMPEAFRAVGVLTPNRWFIDGAALIRDGHFPVGGAPAGGERPRAHGPGRSFAQASDLGVIMRRIRRILHVAWNDLRLMVGDKVFFFWTLAFPIFFIVIFGLVFKAGENTPPVAELTVVNLDEGRWGAYLSIR